MRLDFGGTTGIKLAQYRILEQTPLAVSFRAKDHKLKKEVVTEYSVGDFIDLLAVHVPDHYKHSVRHFGVPSENGQ
jgi:hypothetical protein